MPSHQPRKLTASEVEYLADRCLSRGLSELLDPERMKTDMVLVSALLRVVAREHPGGVEANVWEELD
jgi:hypothetical protein